MLSGKRVILGVTGRKTHVAPMTLRANSKRGALWVEWWRTCIAWCTLVALAWPSLGPLPYVVHDLDAGLAGAHSHAGAAEEHDHGHLDATSIPGSPMHPDDHHCAECDVLKHLSRCILLGLAIAVVT